MSKCHISQFDTFYISFDEPDAESNWAHLQSICPWAQRVHGVKGFDAAHKRCAELSSTDRFITVDGDNLVDPTFFDLEFEIPTHLEDCTLSWAGKNAINGLIYGNGGLKLWTKDFVLSMKTHEEANNAEEAVDFCWHEKYIQLNGMYSTTYPNGSPFQAFRAGFREGVKMTLDRGAKVNPADIKDSVHSKNLKRLLIWASVGSDAENGDFAIYGTRLGIYLSTMSDWDISKVSDYDWFKTFWEMDIIPRISHREDCVYEYPFHKEIDYDKALLQKLIDDLGVEIRKGTDMQIAYLSPEQSEFFKAVYESPKRTISPLATEIEVDSGASV